MLNVQKSKKMYGKKRKNEDTPHIWAQDAFTGAFLGHVVCSLNTTV